MCLKPLGLRDPYKSFVYEFSLTKKKNYGNKSKTPFRILFIIVIVIMTFEDKDAFRIIDIERKFR